MAWNYTYTPLIWPPILTDILLVFLAIYAWHRRSTPGALPFMVSCLFSALWMAGSAMEYLALKGATKFFWAKFQASFQLPYATAITCFFLEYNWPRRWLTRRKLALLSTPPLLLLGLILTNDLHHWIWRDFRFEGARLPLFGPGAWFLIAYAYGLATVNIIASARLFIRSPQHRLPAAFMLTGLLLAYTAYLLQRVYILQPDLLLDVLAVAFASLMYAIALFGFRIFDPISLAHKTVVEQLQAGILVLDPQGRIVSANPAAERIFEAPASQVKGQSIYELLPACSDRLVADPGENEIEIDLKAGQEVRHYSLALSLLKDWRGLEAGRLLLLQDVTEQKRAQAQLLEQQRALAMLHERERLSHELHDGLGQVFAFVNTQGQTIRRLLSHGDVATADACLGRLVEVAREADVDIRETILGLRAVFSEQGFFPALASYLASYEKNYGIHAELEGPGLFAAAEFEPLVEVQLLRILQEALTNVRKHASARCVKIIFALEDEHARIAIRDDGQGFYPADRADRAGVHVGLQVMRERAQEVGGTLSLRSAPGQGMEVVVRVPLKEGNGRA